MSRPAGLSDSESEDDLFYNEYIVPENRQNQNISSYDGNENAESKGNMWFDTDKNRYVGQSNNLNSTYNDERTLYLSTASARDNGKQSTPLSPRRQASLLPFGHIRMAIIQGNLPFVESFIHKGISVDQTIKSGWTLLMVAASSGQDHILEYLLKAGANPNLHKAFFTPLMAAAASERPEDKIVSCIQQLIDHGADIAAAEIHGMTALMFAAKAGKTKVLDVLLRSGADVHKCDHKELTALFWAASAGHKESVKILLNSGADPKKIAMGQNVIDNAMASGNTEMACLLEKHCLGTLESKDWEDLSNLKQKTTQDEATCYRDVENILSTIGAEGLVPIFRKHKVSLTDLLHLTEKDLIKMGICQFGTRFDILNAIKSYNLEEWKKSSLPGISCEECITLEDSVAMVRNMDAHIRYMNASFSFVRKAIETYPQLYNMERKSSDALHLTDNCVSYLKNVNGLKTEIEELKNFLNKECNKKEYARADLIAHRNTDGNWKNFSLMSLGIVATFSTLIYVLKPKLFAKLFIESVPQAELFMDIAK